MMLDQLIPVPRLVEVDRVEVAAPPERVWELLRHGDLARSPLVHGLFALRTLPDRLHGKHVDSSLRIDQLASSPEHPGFQILGEGRCEVTVGAIGKVWQADIPFVHVQTAADFAGFNDSGFVKVAWTIRVMPYGQQSSEVEFEVRVDATDEESWPKFKRYFRLIGPGSHFIRRIVLASLVRELGTPQAKENERPLAGDELLPDASIQVTQGITIAATPEQIWPWLLQMGCRRAGFYSIDALDNGGVQSARELHPELSSLSVGQVLPADPDSDEGFEVLRLSEGEALVLGGLYDSDSAKQVAFGSARPAHFWQVTWSFVLEPLNPRATRVLVRARAALAASGSLHALAIRPVHRLMQTVQLRNLKLRVEGQLPRDDLRDVAEGISGAAVMLVAFASPFVRSPRAHWGLDAKTAARSYPGDDLVAEPRWGWTHGIEIDTDAASVWPWVAQVGADKAGFYSYQWLENLVGCNIRNAETIHPAWQAKVGEDLVLHPDPKAPRLQITAVEAGHCLVAFAKPDETARSQGKPWGAASWVFVVEALSEHRCRLISRYRVACSDDLATRLAFGPALLEPIGFAMDRRMLLGVKERAERVARSKREHPLQFAR